MIRLSLIVAAALALPTAGNKPGTVNDASKSAPVVTASWASHVRMPHMRLPRMPHLKRRQGDALQVTQMNTRLRNLVVQEEAYYAETGVYGRDLNRVSAKSTGDTASANHVQVQILFAGKKGWTAIASHPDAPGKSCTVFVGMRDKLPMVPRTRAEGIDATMEGIPACDSR